MIRVPSLLNVSNYTSIKKSRSMMLEATKRMLERIQRE
jgi:hypothetical protein